MRPCPPGLVLLSALAFASAPEVVFAQAQPSNPGRGDADDFDGMDGAPAASHMSTVRLRSVRPAAFGQAILKAN